MAPRRPAAAAPSAPKPRPAAPARPPVAPINTGGQGGNAFAERLRAQREAAEALAKKRADETRNRLSGASTSGGGPKFSFADEEFEAARGERAPAPTPARVAPPSPPVQAQPPVPEARPAAPTSPPRPPFRPQHTGEAANRPPQPYQPSDAYRQTHGYREYDEPEAPVEPSRAPPSPPAHDRYGEQGQERQRTYTPPGRENYQAPERRDSRYGDEIDDDLFDDREPRQARPVAPRRAGASDYSAAYRDYDDAFDYEDEPRGRGGMWIFVVLMLVVVAVIAAGAYWFINNGTGIGSSQQGGKVPTVAAPDKPVKVEPKPVDNTAVPGAPVRRKKIYDRILGNQTLEPEKLVPSEEKPKTPPPAVVPEAAPSSDAPIGIEPLPLPLPPPPSLPGVQGSVTPAAGKVARIASAGQKSGKAGQTTIAPTAAREKTSTIQSGGQQPPLPLPPLGSPDQTATTVPAQAESSTVPAPPIPRRKPQAVIARARQAAEQQKLAALTRTVAPAPIVPSAPRTVLPGGAGPVQIAPHAPTARQFNTATPTLPAPALPTTPTVPQTNIASLPQPQRPVVAPQPQTQAAVGNGYVLQMSSFRDHNAASAEYRRLVSRHSSVLRGLLPEIQEADLGASGKFYKLRLGSVANRSKAASLCNALIAAGEKDCLVRRR